MIKLIEEIINQNITPNVLILDNLSYQTKLIKFYVTNMINDISNYPYLSVFNSIEICFIIV